MQIAKPALRMSTLCSTRFYSLFVCSLLLLVACRHKNETPKVLVFSKTAGYHHASIPAGIAAIQGIGAKQKFAVDTTSGTAAFTDDSLKQYAAVIFLNTTGNLLNSREETALQRFIEGGGGFVGVHAAADAEYDWGWYGRLVGGYFRDHPGINDTFPGVQQAMVHKVDSAFNANKEVPANWSRADEWYNFKKMNPDIHPLLMLDENSYRGGRMNGKHPVSWYHDIDGGRSFYTAMGHTTESYSDSVFLHHLAGGINYAIGEGDGPDYEKARTAYAPEENRFVKTTLAQGVFFEPTELAILPSLDILVTQRRGEVLRYSQKDKTVKQVGFLKAYFETHTPGVNAEEGVLGITADPDFARNHFVYIYYSPLDTPVNQLSRFTFENDTLNPQSEKVILQVRSQREICCHTGGSLTFGPGRMLYLSTGDNSTPFDEPKSPYPSHGFAPLDDRPGHEQYDSRRSAGNPNDLRGKILRINVAEDGSYTIPDGNLFPANQQGSRPEIFVMGNRNPYRISVDKKTGFLYWGEVGPDAGADSMATRGPKGYDEINQARTAGFYGWPLFVANNQPYRRHNYATGVNSEAFDPAHPVNDSRNNTGLQQLPPAQSAFIWYPYGASPEFPQVGTGGRTAMAGPVYNTAEYEKTTRYPDYFNGKLFIYEWIRNWVKVVTMLPNGDFDKMEPFMEHATFHAPIDMEVGPDGRFYFLEYGSGWFAKNPDAALSRIDYLAGNRPPAVDSLKVSASSGSLPLALRATVQAKDPENDALTYVWKIGKKSITTKGPSVEYTINEAGEYPVTVTVTDDKGAGNASTEKLVVAGNEQPQVSIAVQGNQSFYVPGKPVAYNVQVNDKGDSVDLRNLFISSDFVRSRKELQSTEGHQVVNETILGKNLAMSLDCKSCHQVKESSIGPAFTRVSEKYKTNDKAKDYLVKKIINGGGGVWGETAMPAHPTLSETDAGHIVQWVLSLASDKSAKSLPSTGSISTAKKAGSPPANTVLAISASYTDNGGSGARPLTGDNFFFLRSNQIGASEIDDAKGFTRKDSAGVSYLQFPASDGWLKLQRADLTGVKNIVVQAGGGSIGYAVEVVADNPGGTSLGKGELTVGQPGKGWSSATIPLQAVSGGKRDVYILVKPQVPAGKARTPLLKSLTLSF